MRNCLGKAPGWLFTRDCLAERRGRTLSEIMFVSYMYVYINSLLDVSLLNVVLGAADG